jgi:succinate dehydrogenase / fumarate reductase cytochrome b subunit
MLWTGLIILAFVIFHLLDLTIGRAVNSDKFSSDELYQLPDGTMVTDAYGNLIHSFERPTVAVFYVVVMVVVALHLSHGIWSIINDFGGTARRTRSVFLFLADALALLIVIGNASIPIAVLAGGVSL